MQAAVTPVFVALCVPLALALLALGVTIVTFRRR